jgi:hypothetical protein
MYIASSFLRPSLHTPARPWAFGARAWALIRWYPSSLRNSRALFCAVVSVAMRHRQDVFRDNVHGSQAESSTSLFVCPQKRLQSNVARLIICPHNWIQSKVTRQNVPCRLHGPKRSAADPEQTDQNPLPNTIHTLLCSARRVCPSQPIRCACRPPRRRFRLGRQPGLSNTRGRNRACPYPSTRLAQTAQVNGEQMPVSLTSPPHQLPALT